MVEEKEVNEDKEFYFSTIAKLEDAHYIDEVLNSEKWEVIRRIWLQTRDFAQHKLNGENPEDKIAILRWQMMIDFYDNVMERSIQEYKKLGREAFDAADQNGWLGKLGLYIKKQF